MKGLQLYSFDAHYLGDFDEFTLNLSKLDTQVMETMKLNAAAPWRVDKIMDISAFRRLKHFCFKNPGGWEFEVYIKLPPMIEYIELAKCVYNFQRNIDVLQNLRVLKYESVSTTFWNDSFFGMTDVESNCIWASVLLRCNVGD